MGMGICGGAPSSFLCVAGRGGGDRGRRDYPAQRRVETFPSDRGVHSCVILMLFQRYVHAENFRVLFAGHLQCQFYRCPAGRAGPRGVSRASQ